MPVLGPLQGGLCVPEVFVDSQSGLKIGLNVEIAPEGGVSIQKVDEIKVALRELGLPDDVSFD